MPLGIVDESEFESERKNSDVEYIKSEVGIHINKDANNKSVSDTEIELDPIEDFDSTKFEQNTNQNQNDILPRTPTITAQVKTLPTVGRLPDAVNIPSSLRKVLAETVVMEGLSAGQELANALGGISQPSLSTYARGESSPGKNNDELIDYLNGRKFKVSKKALNKVMMAMNKMEDEKFDELNPLELSAVAKNMALVVREMEPKEKKKDEEDKKNPVQFHIYAPQIKTEQHYDLVTAKDNY